MSSQAAKEALEVVRGIQGLSDGAAGRIKRLINGNDIASINTVLDAPAERIVQEITEFLQSLDSSPGQAPRTQSRAEMSNLTTRGLTSLRAKWGLEQMRRVAAPCKTRRKPETQPLNWLSSRAEAQQSQNTKFDGRSTPGYLGTFAANTNLRNGLYRWGDGNKAPCRGVFALSAEEAVDGPLGCNPDLVLAKSRHVRDGGVLDSCLAVSDVKLNAGQNEGRGFISQQTGQLIAVNLKAAENRPIAICTDGNAFFRVMWLDGTQIYSWRVDDDLLTPAEARATFFGFVDDYIAGTLEPPTHEEAAETPFIGNRAKWLKPVVSEGSLDSAESSLPFEDLDGFLPQWEIEQAEFETLVNSLIG